MRLWAIILFTCAFAALAFGATTEELLAAGDAAYDNHDNEAALVQYLAAFETDDTNCEAAWKISRAYADIGDDKTDKNERTENFNKAEEYARKAIALCPDSDMAHLYLSIAVGRVALMSGKKKQVQLSQTVKDEAEKAIELNPENDIAHHVYARWHRKVATLSGIAKTFAKVLYGGLPPASLDDAVKHFKKAIELKPDYINHYLELGITYEMMKEWQKAKEAYDKVLELPATERKDPEYKKEAKERLKKVEGKL